MKSPQIQLLEFLGGGVRPFDAGPPPEIASVPDFAPLLEGARRGSPETSIGLTFAPSVSGRFTFEQQQQIARGVDAAAMAGIERALILHERQTLRVDVRNRVVLEASDTLDQTPVVEIDGFVSLAEDAEDESGEDSPGPLGGAPVPARVVRNASLLHALAGRAAAI